MVNVIKSIKCETFEGAFTGTVVINLSNELDGNIIDADGVFTVGKTTRVRINIKYLMAVLRNHEVHGAALSAWLDSLKAQPLPMRQAAWGIALNGQEIDIEAVAQEADENHAQTWYSHEIKSLSINTLVIDTAYAVMAKVIDPTLSAAEARELGKAYKAAAEA